MAWTIPSNAVSGTQIPAATTNAILADLALLGTYATYTPTLTNLTISNGTTVGRYVQSGTGTGSIVVFEVQITVGSTTAFNASQVAISLPVNGARTNWVAADSIAFDTSANAWFPIQGIATSASTVSLRTLPGTAGIALQIVNNTAPFTWATGDVLTVAGRYEVA